MNVRKGDVQRTEPEVPSPPRPSDHRPRDGIGTTEPIGGAIEITPSDRPADGGGGDRSAVAPLDRGDDLDPEASRRTEGLQHRDIPGAPAAETVIVADQQMPQAEPIAKDVIDEGLRIVGGQGAREGKHDDVIERAVREALRLLDPGREQWRRRSQIHHLQRMRGEGDEDRGQPALPRSGREPIEHESVASMDPIEGPDGADRATRERGDRGHLIRPHASPRAVASGRHDARRGRPAHRSRHS